MIDANQLKQEMQIFQNEFNHAMSTQQRAQQHWERGDGDAAEPLQDLKALYDGLKQQISILNRAQPGETPEQMRAQNADARQQCINHVLNARTPYEKETVGLALQNMDKQTQKLEEVYNQADNIFNVMHSSKKQNPEFFENMKPTYHKMWVDQAKTVLHSPQSPGLEGVKKEMFHAPNLMADRSDLSSQDRATARELRTGLEDAWDKSLGQLKNIEQNMSKNLTPEKPMNQMLTQDKPGQVLGPDYKNLDKMLNQFVQNRAREQMDPNITSPGVAKSYQDMQKHMRNNISKEIGNLSRDASFASARPDKVTKEINEHIQQFFKSEKLVDRLQAANPDMSHYKAGDLISEVSKTLNIENTQITKTHETQTMSERG